MLRVARSQQLKILSFWDIRVCHLTYLIIFLDKYNSSGKSQVDLVHSISISILFPGVMENWLEVGLITVLYHTLINLQIKLYEKFHDICSI